LHLKRALRRPSTNRAAKCKIISTFFFFEFHRFAPIGFFSSFSPLVKVQ